MTEAQAKVKLKHASILESRHKQRRDELLLGKIFHLNLWKGKFYSAKQVMLIARDEPECFAVIAVYVFYKCILLLIIVHCSQLFNNSASIIDKFLHSTARSLRSWRSLG